MRENSLNAGEIFAYVIIVSARKVSNLHLEKQRNNIIFFGSQLISGHAADLKKLTSQNKPPINKHSKIFSETSLKEN